MQLRVCVRLVIHRHDFIQAAYFNPFTRLSEPLLAIPTGRKSRSNLIWKLRKVNSFFYRQYISLRVGDVIPNSQFRFPT